ncbi:MAG: 2OG-Fe(II) oxygenase [Myxococcales bacterium]|nr:2OG-Fe(II) oxygenase [Myxococcales bacterium]
MLHLAEAEIRALGEGGVVVRDGVVPRARIAAWAAEVDRLDAIDRLTPAGIGRTATLDPSLRGDRTTWLGDVPDGKLVGLHAVFDAVRDELNQDAWLGLRAYTVQLAVYPGDGARYVAHRDAFANEPARRATVILYLNPDWEPDHGGCLRVWVPEGTRDVEPIGGRLVAFLSDRVEHEVLPTHAVRRAATAWYRGPEALVDVGWGG